MVTGQTQQVPFRPPLLPTHGNAEEAQQKFVERERETPGARREEKKQNQSDSRSWCHGRRKEDRLLGC